MMQISVVIPAYNSAAFIADAITSIQKQSYPVFEIIVIDDGSSDDTLAVVKSLPGTILYHKQDNKGPAAARNQGIRLASGLWVAFLDADDQWTPDKIKKQLAILARFPELHLIAGDMSEIAQDDTVLTASVLDKHGLLDGYLKDQGRPITNALGMLLSKNFIPTGTVLVRKETLIAVGMFNEVIHFGEDLELWARISAYYPMTCLPEILMLRRLHSNNATYETASMLTDKVKVMKSLRQCIALPLKLQGMNPDRLVAEAIADVAYWYFNLKEYKKSRWASLASLRESLNSRALVYGLAACLPASFLMLLKQIKARGEIVSGLTK
jgi:glycosyltransferase involved in cell wall biosynthesis